MSKRRQPPSYMSYTSYMSYRVVLWHVADVPGGRGKWKLGSLEAWRLGFLQRYSIVLVGTSQTCRGSRGNWKLGSLEAWRLGFFAQRFLCRPQGRSVLCSPFSVLRGANGAPPLPGRGAAPHIFQAPNYPIPFVSFVIFQSLWQSCVR